MAHFENRICTQDAVQPHFRQTKEDIVMNSFIGKTPSLVIIIVTLFSLIYFSLQTIAENNTTTLSGRVINEHGDPVPDIHLAIKPVKFGLNIDLKQRTHFLIWPRVVTGKDGNFSFNNIDPVSSQLVIFPEHGSDWELHSIEIGSLSFYSIAFRTAMPTWFGKLTLAVEPGERLENVIVHVKEPRMRIRGRVLYEDGTPLINEEINIRINSESVKRFIGGESRSGGSMARNFETDNEGYFVVYYENRAASYNVQMTYQGFTAESEPIILEKGERYDDLVFKLEHTPKIIKRDSVWIVNPATGNAYKKIQCANLHDARNQASNEDAHLVAINDEAEQRWLEGLFKHKTFFWIGLSVPKNDTLWQWDDGQPMIYTNWRKEQQPNFKAEDDGTTGIALDFYAKKWVAIKLNSPFRSAVKMAIIEKEKKDINTPNGK